MRILIVHNFYQQPGGEDQVFASETKLLRSRGHTVLHFTLHNDQVTQLGQLTLARKTLWNSDVAAELQSVCRTERPDVVHFHNTFPLISPAAYYAARREGAAVVQTLHNYRLLCPGTTFYRDGKVCEDCLGRAVPLPGVVHGCYRGSRAASAGVAAMVSLHRAMGTWRRAVDRYVAPTEFLRNKFIEGGLPAEKVVTKPHFLPADPHVGEHGGGYGLFVGRLVEEKGVHILLEAWRSVGARAPLQVAGDGPLRDLFRSAGPNVSWLGQQGRAEITALMQDAAFLVFPSEWFEAFGLTILEAFGTGLPVIASRLGAASELVEHGRTGLHYDPGDPADLAAAVAWAIDHPTKMREMGERARQRYLEHFTAEHNYHALIDIYRDAMDAMSVKRDPEFALASSSS